jgi:hypothetical protein
MILVEPPRLLSVDKGSIFGGGGGDRVSLSDGPHVEAWFLLRRFMDNRADPQAHAGAEGWLVEHQPTLTVYRRALADGAKPLPLRLSRAQAALLARASDGEVDAGDDIRSARALVNRGLAVKPSPGRIRLTAWGAEWLRSRQRRQEGS